VVAGDGAVRASGLYTAVPTNRPATPPGTPHALVVVAGLGTTYTAPFTLQALRARAAATHAVLMPGNLAFADGRAAAWDAWFAALAPLLARAPLLPAPGTHEGADDADAGRAAEDAAMTAYRLRFPVGVGPAGTAPASPYYYARDLAGVHVVALCTQHPTAAFRATMLAWLAQGASSSSSSKGVAGFRWPQARLDDRW
jgi:hypothetical protein